MYVAILVLLSAVTAWQQADGLMGMECCSLCLRLSNAATCALFPCSAPIHLSR
jgi:hypothetical protein